jgi:hypothetical protein
MPRLSTRCPAASAHASTAVRCWMAAVTWPWSCAYEGEWMPCTAVEKGRHAIPGDEVSGYRWTTKTRGKQRSASRIRPPLFWRAGEHGVYLIPLNTDERRISLFLVIPQTRRLKHVGARLTLEIAADSPRPARLDISTGRGCVIHLRTPWPLQGADGPVRVTVAKQTTIGNRLPDPLDHHSYRDEGRMQSGNANSDKSGIAGHAFFGDQGARGEKPACPTLALGPSAGVECARPFVTVNWSCP